MRVLDEWNYIPRIHSSLVKNDPYTIQIINTYCISLGTLLRILHIFIFNLPL